MSKCKKCARCCHWKDENGKIVSCSYLLPNKRCSIYKTRLGKVIGSKLINGKVIFINCISRDLIKLNYKNCNYNGNYPYIDVGY